MAKALDYTGRVLDKLTILYLTDERYFSSPVWAAVCSCGKGIRIPAVKLKTGLKHTGLYCGDKSRHPEFYAEYIGNRYGKLVVQSITINNTDNPVAHCRCDCGGTKDVLLTLLKRGNNKSCGCLLVINANITDIRGVRFGKLIAVRDTGKRLGGSVIWECRCDCGGKVEKAIRHLTYAEFRDKHACTECKSKRRKEFRQSKRNELVGKQVGVNTILDVSDEGVLARCSCGHTRRVPAMSLRSLKSCEKCYARNTVDITNHRFGKLVALYPTDKRYKNSVVWHCKCDCGGTKEVGYLQLSSGNTKSCGCGRLANVLIPNGTQFGDYTVTEALEERSTAGFVIYKCKCRCGVYGKLNSSQLRNGKVVLKCSHKK